MILKKILRILFIVGIIVEKVASYIGSLETSQTDALLSLYHATNRPYWGNKWPINDTNSDPCEWYGISCSEENNAVLGLNLN
jgi:hypothetical protein